MPPPLAQPAVRASHTTSRGTLCAVLSDCFSGITLIRVGLCGCSALTPHPGPEQTLLFPAIRWLAQGCMSQAPAVVCAGN
ncbi:hypothetical protein FKM82_030540 [Ascaphus truei]